MEVRLDGRSAIITGASKGLGLAMAKEFAASGANVAILARDPAGLEAAKAQIKPDGKAKVATFQCDVAKADEIKKAYSGVVAAFALLSVEALAGKWSPFHAARILSSRCGLGRMARAAKSKRRSSLRPAGTEGRRRCATRDLV